MVNIHHGDIQDSMYKVVYVSTKQNNVTLATSVNIDIYIPILQETPLVSFFSSCTRESILLV